MLKKIVGLTVLLFAGGGFFLWWYGGRALQAEQAAALSAEAEEQAAAQKFQQELEENLRAVPTTTIQIAAQAIEKKQAPLARFDPAELAKSRYTLADLKLIREETAKTGAAYKTSIKKILQTYSQNLAGNEISAMFTYLEQKDEAALKLIGDSAANHEKTVTVLAEVSVPVSASLLHLQLLNGLASLRQVIYNMSQVDREPLLAAESAEEREKRYLAVVSAISALDHYFAGPAAQ